MSRKIYAAILGAGTVGTGVYKLCQSMKDDVISKTGAELVVKKVLVRNLHKDRAPIDRELLTDNWKDIIEDKDIEIVIELMGGTTPAKQYILEALEAGKQVVTANKDLLAEYGEEVMGMADKMHADLQCLKNILLCRSSSTHKLYYNLNILIFNNILPVISQ